MTSFLMNCELWRYHFHSRPPNSKTGVVDNDQCWIIFWLMYNLRKVDVWLTIESDVIIFWYWKFTKCPKRNWTVCSVFYNTLTVPKMYNFCFQQKNLTKSNTIQTTLLVISCNYRQALISCKPISQTIKHWDNINPFWVKFYFPTVNTNLLLLIGYCDKG